MRVGAAITVLLALTLAIEGAAVPGIAAAQPMGGSPVDPPARVGRLARLLGTVSFRGADQSEWQAAATNYPVTSGNVLWTEPSSAAEIGVGATQIALDQSTEFDIDILDDRSLQATQPQGAVFLRVGQVSDGELYRITTPRGAVVLTRAGAYEIVAGDADHPTLVTVVEGSARIDSTNASLSLAAGQTGRIEGASNFAVSVGPAVMDRFVTARMDLERESIRNLSARRVAPPRAVAQMSGGEALASTGTWASSASYGEIWYPPVQASWVPYRDGHWGYVAPWGWTWIDDAPWGFAPFHYGRWVQDGSRWGWIPAERGAPVAVRQAPVYAPALVSFISVGVAVGVALSQGDHRDPRGSVGWVPLGPRETYVPPYKTSDRYLKAVNVTNVTKVTNINTVTNISNVNNMVNRRAATVVPVTAMTASQPIAARRENVATQTLATAQPQRAAPVQPTTATIGVTPVVAQELKLAPSASPPQRRVAAPGPVVPPPAAVPVVVHSLPVLPVVTTPGTRPARSKASVTPPVAPVAVTLPVLRAPTPDAPAHPQAGHAPGAAQLTPPPVVPAAKPAPTPVIIAPAVPTPPAIVAPPVARLNQPGNPAPGTAKPVVPGSTPPAAVPATPPIDAHPNQRGNQVLDGAKPAGLVPAPAPGTLPSLEAPTAPSAKPGGPPADVRNNQPGNAARGTAKPVVPQPTPSAVVPAAPPVDAHPNQRGSRGPAPAAGDQAPAVAPPSPNAKPGGPHTDARPTQRRDAAPEPIKPAVPVPPPVVSGPPVVTPVVPPIAVPPVAPKGQGADHGNDPAAKPKP